MSKDNPFNSKLTSQMYRSLPNDTTVNIKASGYPNCLYSYTQFSSASRVIMAGHHQGQQVTVVKPQFDRNFTGKEYDLSRSTIDSSRREQDCEILAIIPKYTFDKTVPVTRETCPKFVVMVRNCGDNTLDYFEIDRYHSKVDGYGFFPQRLNTNRIRVGEIIEKDMPITPSPALQDSKYGQGRNLVICFGTFAETIEDANVISQSAANDMAFLQVCRVPITCSKEKRPVEISTDGGVTFNPFPDIGAIIPENGLIHATRTVNWATCTEDTDQDRLREVQPLHDQMWSGIPGAEILDLDFIGKSRNMPAGYEQVQRYMRNNLKFWRDIYKTYEKYKKRFTPTDKLEELVQTAIYRLVLEGEQLPFLHESHQKAIDNAEIEHPEKGKLDFLHATITYGHVRPFSPGDKLTLHVGGKSVSATVYPDDAMPVDDYGIRADMMISMTTLFGRTIFGPYIECGMTRISEFVRRKVEAAYKDTGTNTAYGIATEWLSDYNPNYRTMVDRRCQTPKQKKAYVEDIIADGFYNLVPPFHVNFTPTDEDRWNAIRNIKKWWVKWEVPSSPINGKTRQRDGSYKPYRTIESVGMGSAYVIHLKHIPRISSPGVSRVGHIGIPYRSSGAANTHPVSDNPSKIGGDEQRVLMMHVDVRYVVRLLNLHGAAPVRGTNFVVKTILQSDKPTAITSFQVANSELLGDNVVLNNFHSTAATFGYDTRATKVSGPINTSGLDDFVDQLDILEEKQTEKVVKSGKSRRSGTALTLRDFEKK